MSAFPFSQLTRYTWLLLLTTGALCTSVCAQSEINRPSPVLDVLAETIGTNQISASSVSSGSTGTQEQEKIAGHFKKWEDSLENLKRLECSVKITIVDKVFNDTEIQTGTYRFLKIKEQAGTKFHRHLDLDCNQPKSKKSTKIIDDKLYFIKNQSKHINIINIDRYLYPSKKDTEYTFKPSWIMLNTEDLFIVVTLTFKPTQILSRYQVSFAKEDDYYLYFDFHPKSAEDKSLFSRGRLVLSKSTFLPRQIWCEIPNNAEFLYDFTSMNLNPHLKVSDFAALDLEQFKGWTIDDSTRNR